ncbi:hypothetical protein Syun_020604 [Stephania yunnanensis]|uniref:Ribosomal protein/NADH dehydrogenase domain-containing protein n=1 Tax=Stephania yunnanensis TaxID=152371 RepID=A0AAP0IG11_9MAGN
MGWRGQLSRNLKELRFLFCQTSLASSQTRFPILIRECSGVRPQLCARYDMGVEKGMSLEGLSEAQITKALEDLVKAGATLKG